MQNMIHCHMKIVVQIVPLVKTSNRTTKAWSTVEIHDYNLDSSAHYKIPSSFLAYDLFKIIECNTFGEMALFPRQHDNIKLIFVFNMRSLKCYGTNNLLHRS